MRKLQFRFVAILTFVVALSVSVAAQSKGFDIAKMDKSVSACTDFFQYTNGTWLKETKIPSSEPRWGSFNILAENNRIILKDVVEKAMKTDAPKDSSMQMIGDFYFSCMDEEAIEKAGAKPLMPYLNEIDRIKNKKEMLAHIAKMHDMGVPALFRFGGGTDIKNSKMNIANSFQGGLSLGNRDYYINGDKSFQETREKLREYMRNMFALIGDSPQDARDNAFTTMKIQVRLAYASMSRVDLRNPDNRYKKISVSEAEKITPNFSWTEYMRARGVTGVEEFNIGQPKFFEAMDKLIADVPLDEWKTYLRWMTIDSAAPLLSKAFVDENFNFYSKHLRGTQEQQPREKQCVRATDGNLGEALGQEYVKIAFKPESKKRMNELIDNLLVAFRERIDKLEWMSDETKVQAQAKLATFKRKIGYPDQLRGYEGLSIDKGSYIANSQRSNEFQIKRNIEDIGKPVDQTRWGMTPPTVNAYYSGTQNEIVFPAGILQPPFFNPDADDAINYGAIGGVIGHEISHGFDDQGSKFDAEGNFKMWWTKEDRKRFEDRSMCVVKQFDEYEVQPKLFMNGKLTLGENIGDLGGLTVAYDAYMKSLEGKPKPEDIDGLTAEQRFFLGWSQVWAVKATKEYETQQVSNDSHALARWRVNGPMSNMPQFAKAFGCKSGSPMVREEMCQIW